MAAKQNGLEIIAAANEGFTSQIDAVGMKLYRNRRAVEWLTRQEWAKDSENKEVREIYGKPVREVFGVSGAFPMYRKNLLDKVLLPGNNLFDPTYHSYKEDLDLAYRLRNAGYVSYVLLDAVAYHDRTGAGPKEMGDWAALKNKKKQSYFVQYHSYKNHLRTLYKNEYWQNILMDFFPIVWYELKKLGYLLLINPSIIFKGWVEIIKDRSYTRSARVKILASRKMYWKGIRRWF
ncbi:MAG: Glycosyl transferase family 2 [Candidatus Magasanikbacteria bacterium GW2011_GWA2_37_8]|uniref:Glycosyl transferase family 2 n=1 Tax=Candidatus Magasanikbacteria bacterium GW2011_GWA2_37_8 TaxID=1619036 RepID=A0A0G0KEP0_9BACT|nr:MAG: Glycosyl transferase family 2 [Candidatus Magasanikbacteria bacterium GW2011_GWA2_37_8]